MRWPPIKSWTSTSLREGFRHFVAINYGGRGFGRWVLLVAVLDGNARLCIPWSEMKDSSKWIKGWLELHRDEANPPVKRNQIRENTNISDEEVCLHPSKDSGFLIPEETTSPRTWN